MLPQRIQRGRNIVETRIKHNEYLGPKCPPTKIICAGPNPIEEIASNARQTHSR